MYFPFSLRVSLDPTVQYTWWSLLIGGGSIGLAYIAVNQVQVQRLMTVKYVNIYIYISHFAISVYITTSFSLSLKL